MDDRPSTHLAPPTYAPPPKVREPLLRRLRPGVEIDNLFFGLASLSVLLLAVVLFRQGLRLSWSLLYLLGFWLVLTYLALPRIHRVLTRIYVPDYFMGRTHTSDGLLGDPVNLAARGTAGQLDEAMTRAGWVRADPVTVRSAWRIVVSSLLRRSYAEAPVSPLFLFGRAQDVAYQQEVAGNPSQRHHVRFWHAPPGWLLPGGEHVDFLGAGTYDRSVGLSLFTLQVTHKIDADIDAERDYIVASVRYDSSEVTTTVLEKFSAGYHSRNGGGDEVHTDGDLPILELSPLPGSATLARLDPPLDHDLTKRPPAVAAGVLLVVGAAVADAFSYLPALHDTLAEVTGIDEDVRTAAVSVVIAVLGLYVLGMLVLAVLTSRAHRWARLLLLAMLTGQVLSQLSQWVFLKAGSLSALALTSTALYVLAVYALSSLSARTYTARRAD